jgi:hypothetical protein
MSRSIGEKLGWKSGMKVLIDGAPAGLPLALEAAAEGPFDLLLVFVPDTASVPAAASLADRHYRDGARLWFADPKKSGARRSDISRDHGWAPVEARDLLPVSQVALDEDWSALRFRHRREIPKLTRRSEPQPPAS